MRVVNVIQDCDDGKPSERSSDSIECVTVHRLGFDDWSDEHLRSSYVVDIIRRFIDDPGVAKYTGGEVAYTFVVDFDGVWWQTLKLTDVGKHARRWSVPSVGVAVLGDFRKHPPTPAQRLSLVNGLAELMPAFGLHPEDNYWHDNVAVKRLNGHDELPGGSADSSKKCPGAMLSMRDLRRDVLLSVERQALANLIESGVVV